MEVGCHVKATNTEGNTKKIIQTLEDKLRASALDFGDSFDDKLYLIELFYNNYYHSSKGMT